MLRIVGSIWNTKVKAQIGIWICMVMPYHCRKALGVYTEYYKHLCGWGFVAKNGLIFRCP